MSISRLSSPVSFLSWFTAGLGVSRLLFEGFFPHLLWLGRPTGALLLALTAGLLGGWLSRQRPSRGWDALLLVNLFWLLDPTVNLPRALIFGVGSLWILMIFAVWPRTNRPQRAAALRTTIHHPSPITHHPSPASHHPVWPLIPLLLLYLATLGRTVGRADTFEFQVVAPQLGIVHPTGYPLYLLLGKLWTLLPFGSTALRLNLGTAVYALTACLVLGWLLWLLLQQFDLSAALRTAAAAWGTLLLGVSPTFWSQAVEAEVYALHLLFVALILTLLVHVLLTDEPPDRWLMWAGLLGGLGMTHHLTTVFMAPPIFATWLLVQRRENWSWGKLWQTWGPAAAAFVLPLSLYAYLPLRWRAVNGEPMGFGRFIDWVVGGRFQDALQWGAWLRDPVRYEVIAQLFRAEWPLWLLLVAGLGLLTLAVKSWRLALILLLTWLGYTFYCLNYYVPDLNVFLLPAHLVLAIWCAAALAWIGEQVGRLTPQIVQRPLQSGLGLVALLPLLWLTAARYPAANAAVDDGRTTWGRGVLSQPLATNGAILADSGKHPPLYYLQQAEGIRPDLDIMVLPDEAAYRQELDRRLAAGQTVYLARFLPNLAAAYHLRAVGPITEVSTKPLETVPAGVEAADLNLGPLTLTGVTVEKRAAFDPTAAAVILYWTLAENDPPPERVFIRWAGERPLTASGTHPANDSYPLNAWRPGEIVSDFYLLPLPSYPPAVLTIEVALGPEFSQPEGLNWVPVAEIDARDLVDWNRPEAIQTPVRMLFGPQARVDGVGYPAQIRPQEPFELVLSGQGSRRLAYELLPPDGVALSTSGERPNGIYQLDLFAADELARCGWLQPLTARCTLGEVVVDGVSLPPNATNFGDLIALTQLEMPTTTLMAGGTFELTATWLALAPIADDWTIFAQILDPNDRIVGQIDQYPLQGVRPTSGWRPGEVIVDPLRIPVAADAEPGDYRLIIGFYRLADLQRLPILDEAGVPIDNKQTVFELIMNNE